MSIDRPPGPDRYEIRLQGRLPARWAAWFDGMSLATEDDGTTVLSGPVVDQAALHGLLQRVRDVGLPLISVTPVGPGQAADRPAGPAGTTPTAVVTTADIPSRSTP